MLLKNRFIVHKARKKIEKAVKQERLKKQIGMEDEDVIIVEKSNMTKFLIIAMGSFIRTIAAILIAGFALIGLTALVYPEPRDEIIRIYSEAIHLLIQYIQA